MLRTGLQPVSRLVARDFSPALSCPPRTSRTSGPWEAESRHRSEGSQTKCRQVGLGVLPTILWAKFQELSTGYAIETQHSGPQTRYRFHVLREPPILAPDQLAQLPLRLQQIHAELLARCGMDQQTYQQRALRLRRRAAQDTTPYAQGTTPGVQDITPSAQDTTNNYKEQPLIEEVWRTIKEALKLEISPPNYQTYLQDTHAIAFDRDTGTLLVEASSPLVANQLNNYFAMTVRRAIAATNASIHGVSINAIDFVAHRFEPSDTPRAEAPPRADTGRATTPLPSTQ